MNLSLVELVVAVDPADPTRVRAAAFAPIPYPPELAVEDDQVRFSTDRRVPQSVVFDRLGDAPGEGLSDFVDNCLNSVSPPPDAVFRLTIETSRDLLAPTLAVLPDLSSLLSRNVVVVAHVVTDARLEARRAPLRVPLKLRIVGANSPSIDRFKAEQLLGASTLSEPDGSRTQGYVVSRLPSSSWRPRAGSVAPEIVHAFVNDVREAEAIVAALQSQGVPRLLVLDGAMTSTADAHQDQATRARIVGDALAAGCDAVLWLDDVALASEVYRKILHNAPLDAAVALAGPSARPPLLAVVPRGEYTLFIAAAIEHRRIQYRRAVLEWMHEAPPTFEPTFESTEPGDFAGVLAGGLADALQASATEQGVARVLTSLGQVRPPRIDLGRPPSSAIYEHESHELRRARLEQDVLAVHTVLAEVAADPAKRAHFVTDLQRGINRYTHVDIHDVEARRAVDGDAPLATRRDYELRIRIDAGKRKSLGRFAFPERAVERLLAQEGAIDVHVHVFHEAGDFEFEARRGLLRLPALGASDTLTLRFSAPERPDRPVRRLRVALYCRDNVLQSVRLSVPVAPGRGGPIAVLDYCASCDFAEAERWRRPSLTIATNDAGARYWIGVRRGETAALMDCDQEVPRAHAGDVRKLLFAAGMNAAGTAYRYDAPLFGAEVDAAVLAERLGVLANLARAGWQMYDGLFGDDESDIRHQLDAEAALLRDGLVQVARCKSRESTLPWALLYDQPLLVTAKLRVCPFFVDDLRANQWTAVDGRLRLTVLRDRLDSPATCRARAGCPLGADDDQVRTTTVCPFGFWGLRHELEQPLQAVGDEDDARQFLGAVVRIPVTDPVPATMCRDPAIGQSIVHTEELKAVLDAGAALVVADAATEVRKRLSEPGAPVCYMFCHAEEIPPALTTFGFRFGPPAEWVVVTDFPAPKKSKGPFLLVLNACESTALLPETADTARFLARLRAMGAEGVIGTEAKVHTHLARPFGLDLLTRALRGERIGRAMLEIRRDMLRQLNPMGLAYTLHGPAGLHLCRGDLNCKSCHPA